jgi:hypothetical protein
MEQFLQSSSVLWYFDIFLIMLERPAVQRQLAALVVILAVAILLPRLINRKLLKAGQEPQPADGEKPPERAPSPADAPVAPSTYPTEFMPLVEEVLPLAQERLLRLLRGFNFMLLPMIWLLGSALVTTWFTSVPGGGGDIPGYDATGACTEVYRYISEACGDFADLGRHPRPSL